MIHLLQNLGVKIKLLEELSILLKKKLEKYINPFYFS